MNLKRRFEFQCQKNSFEEDSFLDPSPLLCPCVSGQTIECLPSESPLPIAIKPFSHFQVVFTSTSDASETVP
ncbi:hypothetical protein TNCV_871331 [Trichonephila clavipes]|nr:hypothetical protein TNCV_871331 [Trichonephila clavipes]